MHTRGPQTDEMTAAQCLAVLQAFHRDDRCGRYNCLDWALAELQEAADQTVASEAAPRRVAPKRLHSPPACRSGAPLEAAVSWLLAGGHTAEG